MKAYNHREPVKEMKKYTPKEKDNVLGAFYHKTHIDYIADKEIIGILIADGCVENIRYADGSFDKLTDKGKGFILQGGYTKERNTRRKQTLTFYLNMVLSALISAIVAYIVSSLNTDN